MLRGPVFSEEQASHVIAFAEAKIDGPLRERLLDGSILVLRCAWLLSPESHAALDHGGVQRLKMRQEMRQGVRQDAVRCSKMPQDAASGPSRCGKTRRVGEGHPVLFLN